MTDAAATPSLVAKSSHRTMPASVLLFILVVLPFLPALHGQFTWDDDLLLANSAQVRAWNGLHLIWNPFVQPIQYFPLTYTTFWLEHKIWGLNTTGYHLVNMLLQGGCAVMLWLALRRLGIRAAWFAALLWAIHPVQVDSVAWISERKNTLSGIFYMLAAWSYLRFERIGDPSPNHSTASPDAADFIGIEASAPYRRNWMFYGLAFAAFIAAMLSKTLVCTFPAGMLIVLWWKREKLSWRDVAPLIPLLVAALALAAITALQEHSNMTVGGSSNLVFSPLQRIIIAGKNIWFYLLTLIVPYPLMPIYPRWTYDSTYLLNYVPAAGTLLLLAVFFIARKKIGKWPLAGFLFFLVTLSPLLGFMNFFTMHYSFVADHYQYLATLGVLVPLAELLRRLGQSVAGIIITNIQTQRFILQTCGLMFIALIGSLTAFYATHFQSNMQLWSWNVAHNPHAFTAQHNLGSAYLNNGQTEEGIRRIQIALQLQPDDDSIQRTAGKLALADGHFQDAIDHFQKAIALRPNYCESYILLGDVYDRMNRLPDALDAYAKAVAVGPNEPTAYIAYAQALRKTRQLEASAKNYQFAINLDPGNMITRYNYANLLLDMHKPKDAIDAYQFILRYDPNNPNVWDNLAAAYYQNGQLDQAIAAKNRAKQLDTHTPIPTQPAN